MLDDYESDDDHQSSSNVSRFEGLSEATQKLMMELGGELNGGEQPEELVEELKVPLATFDYNGVAYME